MEPVDEWTVAELKAELKELGLSNSGNKQDLYDRLLEYEEGEDWDEDESGFDASDLARSFAGAMVRNRVAIGAVSAVVIVVVAVAFAGPMLLDLFRQEGASEPEVYVWEFTVEERNVTDVKSYFINDDTTESVVVTVPLTRNLSSIYIGAYWRESDEQPGGIIGCDEVTMEVFTTDVNKTDLYSLSNTDAASSDCDADGTEPWDHIWYQYDLELPNITGFEGTEEEALAIWDTYTGIGTGAWLIDISVDTYTLWGPVCDCEDGEDVRLTVSYIEYDVNMAKAQPSTDG